MLQHRGQERLCLTKKKEMKMATKRQKKTVVTGVTRAQAEEAFTAYAAADAQEQKITAELELAVVRLRESYQMELMTLKKDKEDAFGVLEAFAREQKDVLFAKKKSLEMGQGVIGFRTGTPKLKTLKGFTWAAALRLVKEYLPGYVRQTEEIAKDKLLADRDGDYILPTVRISGDPTGVVALIGDDLEPPHEDVTVPMSRQMERCGLVVVQEEAFYVEPKDEETDA